MQNITTIDLTLKVPPGLSLEKAQVCSLGPFFQGAMMEIIDGEYAERLHRASFNPYSMRCLPCDDGESIVWEIAALTNEACERVIAPLVAVASVDLKRLDAVFEIASRKLDTVPLKAFTDMISSESPEKARIRIETPASFKSAGEYVFMPSTRLIFQNLLMRYYSIYEGSNEVDEDTLDYICQKTKITSFNIRSRYFDHAMHQGRKVPAFTGTLGLSLKGPQQLRGLCWMLLKFGEHAGLGMKTSMGMGAMRCL